MVLQRLRRCAFLFFLFVSNSSLCSQTIPLISLDENVQEISQEINVNDYQQKLTSSIEGIGSSTFNALDKIDSRNKLKLKTLFLGLSLKAALGLGQVANLSIEPSYILIFEKK